MTAGCAQPVEQARRLQARAGAGMDREDHRARRARASTSTRRARCSGSSTLPARWAVTRRSRELDAEVERRRALVRRAEHDVAHHVAGDRRPRRRHPRARDSRRRPAGRQQQVRERVADDAVDLLRHRAVEGAHAGLDVGQRDLRLGRDERAAQRRVGVAVDEHRVGRGASSDRLERSRCARSAARGCRRRPRGGGRAAAARAPRRRRPRARGRSAGRCGRGSRRGARAARSDGRRLHELRAVANDGEYVHGDSERGAGAREGLRSCSRRRRRVLPGPRPRRAAWRRP